jgi:hypothetical protein
MKWNNFTLQHIEYFKNNKHNISENNILLDFINKERHKISQFIKSNKLQDHKVSLIPNENYDINFKKYIKSFWVDSNVSEQLYKLNKTYLVEWDNINIIIKSNIKPGILKRIKYIMHFINYLKHKTNKQTKLSIYLILSDLKKEFPKNNKIVGIQTANGGYTDFNKNIILVWRQEELEKVLFHELVHFYDMDFRNENLTVKFNSKIETYHEAITDFYAICYHIIFISFFTTYPIKKLLEMEFTFIRNQAFQMIEYMKIKNINNDIIKETTPAFSYFILKYLIFEYYLQNNIKESLNELLIEISKMNNYFNDKTIYKINSSRMTLLQLE